MADVKSQVGYALMDPAFLRDVMTERPVVPARVGRNPLSVMCGRVAAFAVMRWRTGMTRHPRRS